MSENDNGSNGVRLWQVAGGAESKPVGDTLKTVSKDGEGKSLVLDVNRLQSEDSAIKIVEFITDITLELRGKYTLSYISAVPDDQAQLRAIRVRIVPPELSVRFRRE